MPYTRPWEKVEIAEQFKAFRHRNLLTQARLADLIGVCRQTISEIESARTMPHASTCNEFCNLEEKYERAAEITKMVENWRDWEPEEVPGPHSHTETSLIPRGADFRSSRIRTGKQ